MNYFMIALVMTGTILASGLNTPYAKIQKDMNMLEVILQQALKSDTNKKLRIEGEYLAHQGLVYNISTTGALTTHFNFPENLDSYLNFSENIDLPDFEFNHRDPSEVAKRRSLELLERQEKIAKQQRRLQENAQKKAEKAHEQAERLREQAEMMREQEHALSEALLEKNIEVEEMTRDLREAQLEKNLSKTQELKAKIKAMRKEIIRTQEKSRAKLKTMNQQRATRRKAAQEKEQALFDTIENTIINTLCDYGTTIKHLPETEHITFLMRGKQKQRQTLVFKNANIKACASGQLSLSDFKAALTRYQTLN